MKELLGLGLVLLGIMGLEVPPLVRKRQWRELIAFVLFLGVAAVYGAAIALNLPLPTPIQMAEKVFAPLSQALGFQ